MRWTAKSIFHLALALSIYAYRFLANFLTIVKNGSKIPSERVAHRRKSSLLLVFLCIYECTLTEENSQSVFSLLHINKIIIQLKSVLLISVSPTYAISAHFFMRSNESKSSGLIL